MPIVYSQEFFQDLITTLPENTSGLQGKKVLPSSGVSFYQSLVTCAN